MSDTTLYYLDDFSEEVIPYDPESLVDMAKWLSSPDEEWQRETAAQDGAIFKASREILSRHTLVANGAGLVADPPIPVDAHSVMPLYAGGGWDAEDMCETLQQVLELDDCRAGEVIGALRSAGRGTVTYRIVDGTPTCTFQAEGAA